jgi:putative endonuclease
MAMDYLQRNNYIIQTTNYKFGRFWEIDIIANKSWYTVFFEVKYRSNNSFGTGEESITKSKLFKIYKSAQAYCKQYRVDIEMIKIEAIIIEKHSDKYRLKHYKNLEL